MNSVEVSSSYIKKLNHPMKEIRERSLQLLMAKLQLGWGLEDELAGTRKLLEALLAWFNVQTPTLQKEALELLLHTLKTKAGTYISKEIGNEQILSTLNKIKSKISLDATEVFDDVIETLRFLNTVDSEVNIRVPPLNLHLQMSCDSNGSNSGYYDILNKGPSSEISNSNEEIDVNKNDISSVHGINVLLFSWTDLHPSDLKTMILIGDSLKVLKSTRRCCRFIRDVFLRDFPPEIFLNRPAIIKTLLAIADGQYGGHPEEALHVLLSITQALNARFLTLFSFDLVSRTYKGSDDPTESVDNVNLELEHYAGDHTKMPQDDTLVVLRQMPAPIFALDTAHTVLTVMIRSIVIDTNDHNDFMDTKELNLSLSLIENLMKLLLDCVNEHFWSMEHTSKIHRDIAHKACMVMRMLGELLTKYRSSFYKDTECAIQRVAWLRLVSCGEILLNWSKRSALPPSSLITAIQGAQVDPAVELLYPSLGKKLSEVLENAKSSVDQEFKIKYRELNELFFSMDHAVQFMKLQDGNHVTKDILNCIKNALPVLHMNLNKTFLSDMATVILNKSKDLDFDDSEWSTARSIALTLMAHSVEWVRVTFYKMLRDMVRSVLMGDETHQSQNEKCLTILSDVGVLTEICCHGLSSNQKEVESCSSEIMLYLLRGRMVLSESCWWRLLASLLPVLPLLHVFAEHDTQLGKAICKSLEPDIVECMGVSRSEMIAGLVRLVFVNCAAVKLDAVHSLCRLLDDTRYLPPRELLRTDIIMNALRRVETQDFNIDQSSSPTKCGQTSGLVQILDVLKQDLILGEDTSEYVPQSRVTQPTLEPSLRRSTLQQLAVMMRQQELHETFLQSDGLNLIVTLLRLSLMVDDYLAFPECAISCVSVLNSVCFVSRHTMAKISDLPLLLMRVILVFPADENCVLMVVQILSLVAWAGFALQELDSSRHRIPALPLSVTQRTSLPFPVNSYWNTSPNTVRSSVEWLLSEDMWRSAIRVRWWWLCGGGVKLLRSSVPSLPVSSPSSSELAALRTLYLQYACSKYLLALENATSHAQVNDALLLLESYTQLIPMSPANARELGSLPWQHTKRFLNAPPASTRDTALLISLLQFIIAYMNNIKSEENTKTWIISSFIGSDAIIISLLSRDQIYPQQTLQEGIELTQLRIHIVKVLLRCVLLLEHQGDYSCSKMESLMKILLSCLERIDLKDFHVLGYLNELTRCIRYATYSRYCKLSEDTLIHSLKVMTNAFSGCASGNGRKGQACRLDAMLSLLALLRQIREKAVPVQRWSEIWHGSVVRAVVKCSTGDGTELRAAALHVMAALTQYTQLMPQLMQCVPKESLIEHAITVFSREGEANIVRASAASVLTAITARSSPHTQVLEREVLQAMEENSFIEECLHLFIEFCNDTDYTDYLEPNVPLSVLERRSELEMRVHKSAELHLSPLLRFQKPPPTADLVAALADTLHNVTAYKTAPVQTWNERGLYRVLFRCAVWSRGSSSEVYRVFASTCRALSAASLVKCVRKSLAATKDCLYNLLVTLTPSDEEECNTEWLSSRTHGLYLLAALLPERSAGDVVWWELKKQSTLLDILLRALESEHYDLQEPAIHCLMQLARSVSHKKITDNTKEESCIDFLDNLKSPYSKRHTDKFCAGDITTDCQPEYMVEEICKLLMDTYRHCMDNRKSLSSQDEKWTLVCACLCSVLSVSARARAYCVHRHFARTLLGSLHTLRDALSLQSKPVDIIRNADNVMAHITGVVLPSPYLGRLIQGLQCVETRNSILMYKEPILNTLNWVLTLITCFMLECAPAKERIAEDVALSLTRLWPWTMITETLRDTLMRFLVTFTNECPRAWASMCSCVGGRSMLNEMCSLVDKEAARPRPSGALPLSLRTLRHCLPHQHCRTTIIKSDVLTCICKLRARGNGQSSTAASEEWTKLCEAMARHADGASAVLAATALPALKPTPAKLLPALAHAAHHHRLAFLQSPDLLELLSGCLLSGDTAEIVSAARAVWALAANNHRAKLVLRSAGIPSAVQSTLQRLQKHSHDVPIQRALELLTYTQTVLQTT